jgi:PEGA domain
MECEEVEVASELDDCIPGPVTFWQKLGPRFVITLALFGPAATVFLTQYLSLRHELKHAKPKPPTEYAMEAAPAKSAPEPTPAASAPITVDVIANPPRSVTDQPSTLQLTTKPSGATFAVYAGIIADKALPTSAPLRSGTSPGTVEELRAGNYTVFFHKEGWPDGRSEIQVEAGAVLPIDYAFPHAEVTITSVPSGAEILLGTASIGFTPLKVDLPPGQQELTARLKNYLDRKQTLTVDEKATPAVEFQMRAPRRVTRVRPTPTPSFIDRVGGSLKHLFGGNPTPPPSRKRR